MSVRCCAPSLIRFVSSAGLATACALAVPAATVSAQQPAAVDEALVGSLARLLQETDARRFDPLVLRDLMRHPDPAVRRQAALAAGRVRDPGASDLLVPLLGDTAEAVAGAAAFALGLIGDAGSVPVLLAAVRSDGRATVQTEAVTAIAKIGGDAGARAIRQVLQSGAGTPIASPAVSAAILESWRLGERAAVEDLVPYAQSAEIETRWRSLYALGRLASRSGVPALMLALDDRDPAVRAVAVRGVTRGLVDSARLDPGAISARLRPLLGERDPGLRVAVLRSLAGLGDSTMAPAVSPLLAEADLGVVVQAEITLGAIGGAAALDALRGRFSHANFAVRRQAFIGAAQAGGGRDSLTAAALAALAADADWRWRAVAAEAYGAAGQAGPLQRLTADGDARVVARALEALARVTESDSATAERARQLLGHADPVVRAVAADVMAQRPTPGDVEALVRAYRAAAADQSSDARLAVVAAMGAIASASAAGRVAVANAFLGSVPAPQDYLVYRLGVERLPGARDVWGPARPVNTGRSEAQYRDAVRRWLAPALVAGTRPRVTIETDRGTVVVELLPAEAPLTVAAFLELVERRFFDGQRWHRVVPGFVVQGGDPRGDGWGGPGFVLRDEVNPTRYVTGSMGMALSGPDTGGSQFFLTLGREPHLDGSYAVFGRVVEGHGVLLTITRGDRIRTIHL